MPGTVVALHRKPEDPSGIGLPKLNHPVLEVLVDGVVGDHNHFRVRKRGNTPDRALLLYTTDMLHQLRSEGWPIRPGDLGENVLIDGLPYDAIGPGQEYRIGGVRARISEPCTPCMKLQNLPYVGERIHGFLKVIEGRRGWYASVLEEGRVSIGDGVRLV